jgi:hypothetical protein
MTPVGGKNATLTKRKAVRRVRGVTFCALVFMLSWGNGADLGRLNKRMINTAARSNRSITLP